MRLLTATSSAWYLESPAEWTRRIEATSGVGTGGAGIGRVLAQIFADLEELVITAGVYQIRLEHDCLLSLEGGIVELTPARPQIKQDTLYHVYGHYH